MNIPLQKIGRAFLILGAAAALLAACTPAASPYQLPTGNASKSYQSELTSQTASPAAATVTPWTAGTADFSSAASPAGTGVNPLTGLGVENPQLLQRRPILVKVQNLPRPRLQWGLTQADNVFEYYTEQGTTRFAAVFYGKDAERVAPIRSARFVDMQLIRMYKPLFVFGSAYKDLLDLLLAADYAPQLLLEQPDSCPAICRYDPNVNNFLTTDTAALQSYVAQLGIDNSPQELSGYTFAGQAPAGGDPAERVFMRYSGAIYNRWDYDPASGRYLRFSDAQDDVKYENEVYEPLIDQLNNQQVAADTVVFILSDYSLINKNEEGEVYDVKLLGSGMAYAARDGRLYTLTWKRENDSDLIRLYTENGAVFPLKPGQTWYELIGYSSHIQRNGTDWRFTFYIP